MINRTREKTLIEM